MKQTDKPVTNIELLCWGIKHIANNHGLNYDINYQETGEVCIWGGCNIPTLCDVQMLCEDTSIDPRFIESHDYGIDVWLTDEWMRELANSDNPERQYLWKANPGF